MLVYHYRLFNGDEDTLNPRVTVIDKDQHIDTNDGVPGDDDEATGIPVSEEGE